jgi:FlaA1/EpsC-like NDP-sugar epimerase
VVIYGAGRAGRQALATMLANPILGFLPLGFVDEDTHLQGAQLHGYPVYDTSEGLEQIFTREGVTDLVLSAPGLPAERRSAIDAACQRAGVRLLTYQVQWTSSPDALESSPTGPLESSPPDPLSLRERGNDPRAKGARA